MRAFKRLALALTYTVFTLFNPAQALEVQDDCDWDLLKDRPATSALHPSLAYIHLQAKIERGEWRTAIRALREDFEHATVIPEDEHRVRFLRQLRALESEMEVVSASPDYDTLLKNAAGVRLVRFKIERDPDEDAVHLFLREPDQITINGAMPPEVRRQYCWRAITVNRVLTRYGQDARAAAVATLNEYVGQWDAYNEYGYLQFPWELYLNGKWTTQRRNLTPPRHQWIIAHPGIGIEQAGNSVQESRRHEVVTLEPLGYLRYTEDRRFYYGLSLLATFPSDNDVGLGALLHLGRMAKLGYVTRDRDANGRKQDAVVFSIDLYQLLSTPSQQQLDGKAQAQALIEMLRQ